MKIKPNSKFRTLTHFVLSAFDGLALIFVALILFSQTSAVANSYLGTFQPGPDFCPAVEKYKSDPQFNLLVKESLLGNTMNEALSSLDSYCPNLKSYPDLTRSGILGTQKPSLPPHFELFTFKDLFIINMFYYQYNRGGFAIAGYPEFQSGFMFNAVSGNYNMPRQPYLQWDAREKKFSVFKGGAEKAILSRLPPKTKIYRGTSIKEVDLFKFLKKFTEDLTMPLPNNFFEVLKKSWVFPSELSDRIRLACTTTSSSTEEIKEARRNCSKTVLTIIGNSMGIFTSPDCDKVKNIWAKDTAAMEFEFNFEELEKTGAINEIYAGTELGYIEISFVGPNARQYLLEHITQTVDNGLNLICD